MEFIREDIELEKQLDNKRKLNEWIASQSDEKKAKIDQIHSEFLDNGEYSFAEVRLIRKCFEFMKERL